jgi:hypothetical protein
MITVIANILFVIIVLFCAFAAYAISYSEPTGRVDNYGQSERQERDDDYNDNYHPFA